MKTQINLNSLLSHAIAIASKGFVDVLDKGNNAYIMHCIRVMNNLDTIDAKIIGILHDCIEDGVCTINDLREKGFPEDILTDLNLLTHDKKEPYEDYIKRISLSKRASRVKLADLKDNSDITRLKGLSKKDFDRLEKYCKAYTYLKSL